MSFTSTQHHLIRQLTMTGGTHFKGHQKQLYQRIIGVTILWSFYRPLKLQKNGIHVLNYR